MLRTSLLLAMLALSGSALAQTSQKAIQIIAPFQPGGSADSAGGAMAIKFMPATKPDRAVATHTRVGL